MPNMKTNLTIKLVTLRQSPPVGYTIEHEKKYIVIYTREVTNADGSSGVVVALQEYDLPVTEYPLSWFSLEDWDEAE